MTQIELVYDKDCPNVDEARKNLQRALDQAGLPKAWKEWDRDDPATPVYARTFGSPTILVNGKDIAGFSGTEGNNCRVYPGARGKLMGVPPVEQIVTTLVKPARGNGKALPVSSCGCD